MRNESSLPSSNSVKLAIALIEGINAYKLAFALCNCQQIEVVKEVDSLAKTFHAFVGKFSHSRRSVIWNVTIKPWNCQMSCH